MVRCASWWVLSPTLLGVLRVVSCRFGSVWTVTMWQYFGRTTDPAVSGGSRGTVRGEDAAPAGFERGARSVGKLSCHCRHRRLAFTADVFCEAGWSGCWTPARRWWRSAAAAPRRRRGAPWTCQPRCGSTMKMVEVRRFHKIKSAVWRNIYFLIMVS